MFDRCGVVGRQGAGSVAAVRARLCRDDARDAVDLDPLPALY